MRKGLLLSITFLFLFLSTGLYAATRPMIDLLFCVDTTQGMKDEIKMLDRRVDEILRALREGRPKPALSFSVVAYRDQGEEYVSRVLPLGDDEKELLAFIEALEAEGGGGPEDLRSALSISLEEIDWRSGTRIIVLLSDAAANEESPIATTCSRLAAAAKKKGISILALSCAGMNLNGKALWKRMAQLSDGMYAEIPPVKSRKMLLTSADCVSSSCASCSLPCDSRFSSTNTSTAKKQKVRSKSADEVFESTIVSYVKALASKNGIAY